MVVGLLWLVVQEVLVYVVLMLRGLHETNAELEHGFNG